MTNPKHTPGPWEADLDHEDLIGNKCPLIQGRPTGYGYDTTLAFVQCFPAVKLPIKVAKANACLMTAAPELLEALELATECLMEGGWAEDKVTVPKLQSAIAKAKGES